MQSCCNSLVPGNETTKLQCGSSRASAARCRFCGGLLLAALLGCTTPPSYYVAEGHEGAPGVQRVLLCPLNVAVSLPAEIASGTESVYRELTAYLGEQGLQVEHLSLIEARRRWGEAVAEARRTGSKDAAAIFARDLGEWIEFDAMLMPSLILHSVRVTDSSGTWDGVRRRVKMVNLPSRGIGGSADTFTKGVAFGGISASVLASSLHVTVLSPDGRLVFEGQGGFDFAQEADLGRAYRWKWELRRKSGLLRDPAVLREGVEIALGPYLPPRDDR
jgi:hypothetical protein